MISLADIVRLNSGGPRMFVSELKRNGRGQIMAFCEFGYPQNGSTVVPVECLTKIDSVPKQFFVDADRGKLGSS